MTNWFTECDTIENLKRRYRELSLLYHPDKGGKHEVFLEIKEQYEKESKELAASEYITEYLKLITLGILTHNQLKEAIKKNKLTKGDYAVLANYHNLTVEEIKLLYDGFI